MIEVKLKTRSTAAASSSTAAAGTTTTAAEALTAHRADRATAADEAAHAAEADHARRADRAAVAETAYDLAEDSAAAKRFLSRLYDDVAAGVITFEQAALMVAGLAWGEKGEYSLTAEGGAVLDDGRQTGYSLTTDDSLIGGKGFHFSKDADGRGVAWVDELYVRAKAVFQELEVRRLSYTGGNRVASAAGGRLFCVERLDKTGSVVSDGTSDAEVHTWRCYLYSDDGTEATENGFKAGDQVRCQTLNLTDRTSHEAQNREWWRLCLNTGRGQIEAIKERDKRAYEYIDLCGDRVVDASDTAVADYVGSWGAERRSDNGPCDYPQAEDTAVQLGSWTDSDRQNAIVWLVSDDTAPAFVQYKGLGAAGYHFTLDEKSVVTRISPSGNLLTGDFRTASGTSLEEHIRQVEANVTELGAQSDLRLDIWFGAGAPHPQSATDTETNAPASDWTTDETKGLHVGDLYYDTTRDPAATGGRAWKYNSTTTDDVTTYYWGEVTDADTVAALEKAAALQGQVDNLASDGVISGGAEKSELLTRWTQAEADYNTEAERAADYELTTEQTYLDLVSARDTLAALLNGGTTLTDGSTPAWIATDALSTDTTVDAEAYRKAWADFYEALAAMRSLYLESSHKKYDAGIEKTDKTAALWSKTFNDDGTVKEGSNVMATPSGAGLVSYDSSGKTATIGTYDGGKIKLSADQIELDGNVEAHLLRSETQNIESNVHDFGEYGEAIIIDGSVQNIRVDSDCTFLLPCDPGFVGMRLLIVGYPPVTVGKNAKGKCTIKLYGGRVLVKGLYAKKATDGTVDTLLCGITDSADKNVANGNDSAGALKRIWTNYFYSDRILGTSEAQNTQGGYETPNCLTFVNGAIELLGLPVGSATETDAAEGFFLVEDSSGRYTLDTETGTVKDNDADAETPRTAQWTVKSGAGPFTQWCVVNYYSENAITGDFETATYL